MRHSPPSSVPHQTQENVFALDAEDPDDGEIEDLSCISSQEGLGDSCSEVSEGDKVKAEDAYYQYKRAHKQLRQIMPTRFRRGYGRKGEGKGNGKKVNHTYFKPRPGKGSGRKGVKRGCYQSNFKTKGKGKGNKANRIPFGRDGNNMLCSLCSSPDHFRLECPENPDNKGKGAHVADKDHDDWEDWKGDWSVPTTSWFTITEEPNEDKID